MRKCLDFLDSITFECDWKDMGLLKFCLASLGALMGMMIPRRYKDGASILCGGIFVATTAALIVRLIADNRSEEEDWDEEEWDEEEDPGFVMRITAAEEE